MSILILNGSPAGDESITLTGKVEEQNAGAIYGTLTGFSAMKAEQTLNGEFSDEDDSERFSMIGVCTLDPDCASFAIWLYNGELDSVSITVNAALTVKRTVSSSGEPLSDTESDTADIIFRLVPPGGPPEGSDSWLETG
jgi:hypothetical protein